MKGNKSGKEFAMKIIEKAKLKEDILLQSKSLETLIVSEDSPFIVKIFNTSQNTNNIYILMEYLPGRDLYYYLFEEDNFFSEAVIAHVAAETISGLLFLHSKDIIYRELKP